MEAIMFLFWGMGVTKMLLMGVAQCFKSSNDDEPTKVAP
jgi:hypothetical protein